MFRSLQTLAALVGFIAFAQAVNLQSAQQGHRDFSKNYLLPAAPADVYLYCNFDKDDCNLNLKSQTNNPDYAISEKVFGNARNPFTDYTSSHAATANGKTCILPYNNSYIDHYFCNEENECLTESGFSKCSKGRFLSAMLRYSTEDTTLNLDLPFSGSININIYELSFYAFMDCDYRYTDCRKSNAQLIVTVYRDEVEQQSLTIKYSDFGENFKWTKFSMRLGNVYQKLKLKMRFMRDPGSFQNYFAYFGVDEIKLEASVSDPGIVTQCDFDETHCSVNWAYVGNPNVGLVSQLTVLDNTFTDVTSTTKRAKNGERCQIPFTINGKEYHHCTENYECLTALGLSECAPGRFVGGMYNQTSIDDTKSIKTNFKNTFEKNYLGAYKASYRFFLKCAGVCPESSDHMAITVWYDLSSAYTMIHQYYATGWTYDEIDIVSSRPSRISLEFKVYRAVPHNSTVFFGIDDIKLTYTGPFAYGTTTARPAPETTTATNIPDEITTNSANHIIAGLNLSMAFQILIIAKLLV